MQIDRDYDIAIAKIPRTDRSGNDITEDKLGGGGRHRPDGTISGMAYDFEIIDEDRYSKHGPTNLRPPEWKQLLPCVEPTCFPSLNSPYRATPLRHCSLRG